MYKCQYCGKEFNNIYGLGGHTSHCKLNPNYNEEEREKQQKKALKAANLAKSNKAKELEATRKERKLICKKCGKEYILKLTDKEFENEKYSKFCSRSCANSRQHSEETKKKISQSAKETFKNHPELCKNQYSGPNKEYYISKIKTLTKEQKKEYSNPNNYKYISELISLGYVLNNDNYNYKDKLINYNNFHKHNCIICGKEFYLRIIKSGKLGGGNTCCEKCHKELIKQIGKETYQKVKNEGRFQGWKSRNIASYAEKFWKQVLDNNDIKYIREQLVEYGNLGNGERYFLDFYIEHNGRKIDLEIDGKQHKYKDRQESDIKRDEFLKSLGYEVYRIDWNSINNDKGKKLMEEKINKFLDFYNMQVSY